MSSAQSDQFNSERMILLKEISNNPDYDIYALVDRLSIPRPTLELYLRSFFKTMAQFTDSNDELDRKSYQDIQSIINSGVQTEFGLLGDKDIDNLYYVYQKYRKIDPTLYSEADQVRGSRVFEAPPGNVAIAHNASNPLPNTAFETESVQQPTNVPAGAPPNFNVDRLNRGYNYDFLATLTRVGLMRHVLEHLPHGPSTPAIENWIPIFELNQDDLMASPDILRLNLVKNFGDRTGDNAATSFNSYIGFLKPTEYYGVRKVTGGRLNDGMFSNNLTMGGAGGSNQFNGGFSGGAIPTQFNPNPNVFGQQQQQGPNFVDPYNTYYHAEGVLPFGMDIRTMDARKLIHEWEVEKKRKKRQADELDEMMTKANQKMQMQMANMFDSNKAQQQNGMGDGFMQNLVMMSMISMVTSGKANLLPYTDENGKMQMKVESTPQLQDSAHMADPNTFGLKDVVGLFERMNDKVSEKASEAMNARVDMMEKFMGVEKKDPVQVVGETVKALKEVIPGFEERFSGGGPNQNVDPLEYARIILEKEKFNFDRERTDKLIDHKYELERQREEYEREDSLEANKTRRQTMKLMTNSVVAVLPTIMQIVVMLMSRRNPDLANVAGAIGGSGGGGGLGGLGGIIGNVMKLLGGAGGGLGGGGDEEDDEDEDEEDDSGKGGGGLNDILGGIFGGGGNKQEEDEAGPNITQMMNNAMNLVGNMTNKAQKRRQQPMEDEYEDEYEDEQPMTRRQQRNIDGMRPTFTQVAYGNPRASIPKPAILNPNSEIVSSDDIYSSIERENEKRTPVTESTQEQRVPGLTEVVTSVHKASVSVSERPSVISLPRYQEKMGIKSDSDKTAETTVSPSQQLSHEEGGVVIPSPRSQVITPQPQSQPQQLQEEDEEEGEDEDDYSIYTPEDFEDFTDEELRDAFNRGKASIESDESYLSSIGEQLKKRASTGKGRKKG